jgi:WhiB family redox-sensing transcriptional regulator
MAGMSWEMEARCRAYDPEIFFEPRARSERRAKAICSKCEVRTQCLAFALQSRSEFGVWGGLNVRERAALARVG